MLNYFPIYFRLVVVLWYGDKTIDLVGCDSECQVDLHLYAHAISILLPSF